MDATRGFRRSEDRSGNRDSETQGWYNTDTARAISEGKLADNVSVISRKIEQYR